MKMKLKLLNLFKKKLVCECTECHKRYKTERRQELRFCPNCREQTSFVFLDSIPLIKKAKRPFHVICARCLEMGFVKSGILPKKCPVCGNPFKRRAETVTQSAIDWIHSILVGGTPETGWYLCDKFKWVETTDDQKLPFPEDRFGSEPFEYDSQPFTQEGKLRPVTVSTPKRRKIRRV